MLKKRKLAAWGGCSLSSDADYEFCHSFCSRRDNRVCAKDVCIFLGAGATGCSNRAGADHKRSLQFFICRNRDRRTFLVRIFI